MRQARARRNLNVLSLFPGPGFLVLVLDDRTALPGRRGFLLVFLRLRTAFPGRGCFLFVGHGGTPPGRRGGLHRVGDWAALGRGRRDIIVFFPGARLGRAHGDGTWLRLHVLHCATRRTLDALADQFVVNGKSSMILSAQTQTTVACTPMPV